MFDGFLIAVAVGIEAVVNAFAGVVVHGFELAGVGVLVVGDYAIGQGNLRQLAYGVVVVTSGGVWAAVAAGVFHCNCLQPAPGVIGEQAGNAVGVGDGGEAAFVVVAVKACGLPQGIGGAGAGKAIGLVGVGGYIHYIYPRAVFGKHLALVVVGVAPALVG